MANSLFKTPGPFISASNATAHNFPFETVAKSKTTNLIKVLFEWPHSGSSPKKKACHDCQWDNTERTDDYNNGESTGAFHFVLDGGSHSWDVVLSSYIFPLFVADDKDVAI